MQSTEQPEQTLLPGVATELLQPLVSHFLSPGVAREQEMERRRDLLNKAPAGSGRRVHNLLPSSGAHGTCMQITIMLALLRSVGSWYNPIKRFQAFLWERHQLWTVSSLWFACPAVAVGSWCATDLAILHAHLSCCRLQVLVKLMC